LRALSIQLSVADDIREFRLPADSLLIESLLLKVFKQDRIEQKTKKKNRFLIKQNSALVKQVNLYSQNVIALEGIINRKQKRLRVSRSWIIFLSAALATSITLNLVK